MPEGRIPAGFAERRRAAELLAVFGVTLVVGILLFIVVDPGIQTVNVKELVARRSDAVAYFTLDYVFVVLYAVAGPFALWRFGRTLAPGESRVPSWLAVAVVALVVGGLLDAVENALLWSASSSGDASTVRLAHVLAIPKWAFGILGFLLSLRAIVMAVRALRG